MWVEHSDPLKTTLLSTFYNCDVIKQLTVRKVPFIYLFILKRDAPVYVIYWVLFSQNNITTIKEGHHSATCCLTRTLTFALWLQSLLAAHDVHFTQKPR